MSTTDAPAGPPPGALSPASAAPVSQPRERSRGFFSRLLPKGLYTRSLLIIIVPIVILQSVIAFVFMERHWDRVTTRLSSATVRSIAAIIEVLETYDQDPGYRTVTRLADEQLNLSIAVLPPGPLPSPKPKQFFSLLDQALSRELSDRIGRPFWIDTIGRSKFVEIQIKLDEANLRILARRSQTYASNTHIFLAWMIGTSVVLIGVAILFLRNQIRPIERLADAAEGFGKGRNVADFEPRGAREVRRASQAFIEMRRRIERQIEQRTTMLAGVSHDLRTILTRFRLQLALLGDTPATGDLKQDVTEMEEMLEAYVAFAKGDGDESTQETDIQAVLKDLAHGAELTGATVDVRFTGDPILPVRPNAIKRCLINLIVNACRYGDLVIITASHENGWLTVNVDDDGPGIPPEKREIVFRAFVRLDQSRNQDDAGTGLGLAIARDIARTHGGDVELTDAPLGGLRASLRIPG
ncbi:MAG: ATP-binding protein [Pseudomonadota bacterium]